MHTLGQTYGQFTQRWKFRMTLSPNICWVHTYTINPSSCRVTGCGYSGVPSLSFEGFRKHCAEGRLHQALQAVHRIPWHASSTTFSITFNCLLQGCIRNRDLATCREVYSLILKHGFEANSFLGTSLIRVFAMHGLLAEANVVFARVLVPDVFTWSALISAYSKHGQAEHAIKLYHKMKLLRVKPDTYVFVAVLKACADCASAVALVHGKLIHSHIIERGFELALFVNNSLINMYGRCGALEDALIVFNQLPKKDAVTWSAIIGGHSLCGCGPQAFQLFKRMQKECNTPDQISFVSALKACCGIAALDEGKLIHSQVIESELETNAIIGSTLVDMYAKCGNLEDAKRVFGALTIRDVVTWSAMIAGYTFNSEYGLALQHYKDMKQEGLKPNEAVFLCVLSACSQMGLVDESDALFNSMIEDFGIKPTKEHLNCVVSLLGRAGRIQEAEDMLRRIPFKSNIAGWTSLLNCCKIYGEVEVGKHCFNQIIKIDCRDASAYALMSDIYAAMGMWEDASNTKRMKESAQAWKKPGKAFIHVNDMVHEFIVSDTDYNSLYDIYGKLQALSAQMKEKGHVPQQDMAVESHDTIAWTL